MSATLLQRVADHLSAASLLDGYDVRFFRWTDVDADGNTPLVMFRMAGSQGALTDFSLQYLDVQFLLLDNPASVVSADTRCRDIVTYIRENFDTTGALYIDPLSAVQGPFYLDNGRPWFMMDFRVIVSDH